MSTRKINQKQIEAVLALPAAKRYDHFIKLVADWQELWGLYNDGWAMAATESGEPVFPMWPAEEYAARCIAEQWIGYLPEKFSLDELQTELLPKLKKDGILPGVFFLPSDKGITPTVDELQNDLKAELDKYSD
mgnify:CR=1 FL=1